MKSMKRLVLAGLVLLASVVGLVPLAGCKNDSVPEVPKCTVEFETYYGTTPASITVERGTKLTAEQLQALPDTEDDIFEGWYDGETQAKGGEYTVTKDVTLVARWRNRDTVASVDFAPSSTKLYYGETVTVTLSTTTEGATIHYQLGEGEWKIYEKPFTVSSETVVTAYATKDELKDSEKTKSNYLRQLISITVTPPTRTVYSVGESFDDSGMIVTATYDDGEERTVEGTISETSSLTKSAGIDNEVTVSYTEGEITKQSSFTVVVFPEGVKILTNYTSPNNTGSEWTYVAFGDWPQTIKADGVNVDETQRREMGMFTAYLGSDGNYYVKAEEKANGTGEAYKYSDGNQAEQDGTSTQWFKVEPIVWRVLNKNYSSTGQALLLAENILTGGIPYYVDTSQRTITGAGTEPDAPNTVYPNNYKYSTIRAWLNGKVESNDTQEKNKAYEGIGFLQTAFTQEARELITTTIVDNSARSTNSEDTLWYDGKNVYACENTTDKIFLLSEQEVTMSDYGFGVYSAYGKGNTRIRVTTDYAKATGAYQIGRTGEGGWWWLRSPTATVKSDAHTIRYDGLTSGNYVDDIEVAVVPALCIELQ